MKFSENLQALRKGMGLSQEQFAEQLQVSRQAVSKWESGSSYPEMDKLLLMSKLFQCTLDELVQGTVPKKPVMISSYLSFHRHFAAMITTGVILLIIGVITLLALEGMLPEHSNIPVVSFLSFVFVAVLLFVYYGLKKSDFDQQIDPEAALYEIGQTKKLFLPRFRIAMVTGVGLCILAVIMMVLVEPQFSTDSNIPVILFLGIIALALILFIYYGMMYSAYHETFIEDPVKKNHDQLQEKLTSIIMLIATIIFLFSGFVFHLWHPAWVVFPIGGILCGIVSIIYENE